MRAYIVAAVAASMVSVVVGTGWAQQETMLQAGDANMDWEYNQLDLVKVQIAAKYLTGQPATWGEGDWNGAPGGSRGNPPPGNGLFDQMDIIASMSSSNGCGFLQYTYGAVKLGGVAKDRQTSVGYDANSGEVWVDAFASNDICAINMDSASGIFTGEPAQNLGGSFDNDSDTNIFKATFGSDFGSLSFGNVAQPGLAEGFIANDLTVMGRLTGGGDFGDVDLIYIPEPSAIVLAVVGLGLLTAGWRRRAYQLPYRVCGSRYMIGLTIQ